MDPDSGPPGDSDESLLRAFLEGDESAFTRLMSRHEDRIFALAFRMTGNRSDALDATQDTFVQLFRQAAKFRGDSAFGTWLYRIGVNMCHDLLRKRSRLPDPSEPPVLDAAGRVRGVDDASAARIDVARALQALPEEYREAVVMYDLGGIPYEEIGRITQVSIGTVKSRISRGRKRLAGLLEQASPNATSKDRK